MNIRKLAKERNIKYYCCKSRKELCEELGIENKLGITTPIKITLTCVRDGELFYFRSLNAVARAVDRTPPLSRGMRKPKSQCVLLDLDRSCHPVSTSLQKYEY